MAVSNLMMDSPQPEQNNNCCVDEGESDQSQIRAMSG